MNIVAHGLSGLALSALMAIGSMGGAAAQESVKFGILTGLSGDYRPWGEAGLAAARLAVEDVNAAGGIAGRPLELVVADHRSTIEGAIAGWRRLVEVEGAIAVGGMESDFALALLDEAADARVPIMCPACGTPRLSTLGGDYVWRLTSGDDDLGVVLAQIAAARAESVTIITQGGLDAAEGISDVFVTAYGNAGGTVADHIHVSADAASFRGELSSATGNGDHIVLSTGLEVGTRILSEYLRRGHQGTLYVIPELIANEVASLGGGAFEDMMFGANPSYDLANVGYIAFAEAYEAQTGIVPSSAMYEPNYYDQIIVLALAAAAAERETGMITGETIRDRLIAVTNQPGTVVHDYAAGLREIEAGNEVDYFGASGPLDFDVSGNVASVYGEVTPRDGQWVEVRNIELDPSLRPAAD